jgi:hypothetical protein
LTAISAALIVVNAAAVYRLLRDRRASLHHRHPGGGALAAPSGARKTRTAIP